MLLLQEPRPRWLAGQAADAAAARPLLAGGAQLGPPRHEAQPAEQVPGLRVGPGAWHLRRSYQATSMWPAVSHKAAATPAAFGMQAAA